MSSIHFIKKIFRHFMLCLSMLFAFNQALSAQDIKQKEFIIYYDHNNSNIDRYYELNAEELDKLEKTLHTVTIQKIHINSYSSLEGGLTKNKAMSIKRSKNIHSYLNRIGHIIDANLFEVKNGDMWTKLTAFVSESDMPYKDEFIRIIETEKEETWGKVRPTDQRPQLLNSRNKSLMDLQGGVPYIYMMKHISPKMRVSIVKVDYLANDEEAEDSLINEAYKKEEELLESLLAKQEEENNTTNAQQADSLVEEENNTTNAQQADSLVEEAPRDVLFSLKTNALYLAALTPNIEIEVPMGKRWSVGLQGLGAWWRNKDNTFAWQLQAADLEARYWFGDRTNRQVMTGWFLGAFGSMGHYDFQLKETQGTQGAFKLAGLSGGYSHSIGKRFYMEFALGLGYLWNDYKNYDVLWGEKLVQSAPSTQTQSFVPAKAEITLAWLLFKNKKEKEQE